MSDFTCPTYSSGLPSSPWRKAEPERGLRLAGAAAVLREATGIVHTDAPPWIVERGCWLAAASRTLDGETATTAWRAGRALSLEQALDEALAEEFDRLTACDGASTRSRRSPMLSPSNDTAGREEEGAMAITITGVEAHDIRFPTSRTLDGSDAMNPDPDYSAAYVILRTDSPAGGRGPRPDLHDRARQRSVRARRSRRWRRSSSGRTLESFTADMGGFWRRITGDSQLRWVGPEKGVIHLATAAVVNAVWDLWAKVEGKPLWKLLADMTPEQIVALRRLSLHHATR